MNLEMPQTELVPIEMNAAGVIVVSGTRIPIDTVIHAHLQGETPEQIVENYDTLSLADVYAIILYYLRHQPDVDAYLRERAQRRAALYQEIEARYPERIGQKARLLERKAAKEKHAPQSDE